MKPASIEWIDSCESTNTLMKSRGAAVPHAHVIATRAQTAGRGQRGNSWEAAPAQNLTYSQMLLPDAMDAARQFELSMLTALAILDVLRSRLPASAALSLKWPNDIYAADRKLGGILIEGSISASRLDRMVLGVGINVNQTEFLSDAPNPVSMATLAGHTFRLEELLQELADAVANAMEAYEMNPEPDELSALYMANLWRRTGLHPYRDTATDERFDAEITGITPAGLLCLRTATGESRTYEFKQVAAVL